jgi:hypothetical protein
VAFVAPHNGGTTRAQDRSPRLRSRSIRSDHSGVEQTTAMAGYQDAICALRLAIWTLERSAARDGVDPLHVVELIARRAEELRQLLVLERAIA